MTSSTTTSHHKNSTRATLLRLIREEVRQQGWRYGVYLSVIAMFALISVLPPRFYAYYVEHVSALTSLDELSARAFLNQLMVFGVLIAAVMFTGNLVRILCEEWVCLRIEGSLRQRFMQHSQRLPFERLDGAQRGEWLTRMSRDIRTVEQFITTTLPQQLQDLVVVLAIGALFVYQNGVLALVMLGSSAFIAAYNVMVQRRLNPIIDHLREMHGQVFQTMLENFEGMRTIRSFRIEGYVLGKFQQRVDAIIGKGMRAVRWVSLMVGSNAFAVNLLTAGILSLVGWMLRGGRLTVSDVFSYPFYIGMFYASVFALVRSIHEWNEFMVHGKRLMQLMDETPHAEEAERGNAVALRLEVPGATQRLELSGVVLGYAGAAPLTRPFDFALRQGETVMIKGSSGGGKTTLLEALAGLRQFSVQRVRSIGGDGKEAVLYSHAPGGRLNLPLGMATFVEQRPFLFAGSLRENVALDKESTADAELWEALSEAHIAMLPQGRGGLELVIADDGGNLSEGQKQRISLARGFLHRRPFILLDEPFATLDEESVAHICQTINNLRPDHGIVIVSHVLPQSLKTDRVIDFDDFLAPHLRRFDARDDEAAGDGAAMPLSLRGAAAARR